MVCKSYENGNCKHYPGQKCPVMPAIRDMFGDMDACAPVEKKKGSG